LKTNKTLKNIHASSLRCSVSIAIAIAIADSIVDSIVDSTAEIVDVEGDQ
jgi:hypothetical protein